jgi:hypothetical protein
LGVRGTLSATGAFCFNEESIMKRIVAIALLMQLLTACTPITINITIGATPTSAAPPTSTPIATPPSIILGTSSTPISPPTSPVAGATLPAAPTQAATAAPCIAWKEAADHVGETTCVRGTVYSANKSVSTFFIDFDGARASFYGVSFRHTWDDLRGKCVEISGKISPYNGRPQIVIDNKEQVRECAN